MTEPRDEEALPAPSSEWALSGSDGEHPLSESAPQRIGRALECEIVLDDPSASRHHATIRFTDGRPRVEDARSRHGTTLNGQRLEAPAPLKHGDRIGIGGSILVVVDLRRKERAQRETVQLPALPETRAGRTLRSQPVTGEHDPVAALIAEIQLAVDAGEAQAATTLVEGVLRSWGAQSGAAIDEGTLRRGATAILRATSPEHPEWIDALVGLHRRRGALMHASTLDQLEAAIARARAIDWDALAEYTTWLDSSGVVSQRGDYGRYCSRRLGEILRRRP